MGLALDRARAAGEHGDVPIGAVIEREGEVIGAAGNERELRLDPTAHAEIVALRQAAAALGNYRLPGCELYVTLEPCAMCVGALVHARLARVVYGTRDPKTGACGSIVDLPAITRWNHHGTFEGGVLTEECAAVLRRFFAERRG